MEKRSSGDEEAPFLASSSRLSSRRPTRTPVSLPICLLSSVLVISAVLNLYWWSKWKPQNLDRICSLHTSQAKSPIQADVPITYTTIRYSGSLLKDGIYRSAPSPDVDAAWFALGTDTNLAIIPEAHAEEFSLDPAWLKRIPEEGGGYPVLFEFEHHLHCLNVLRMTSHWNYDYYKAINMTLFHDVESIVHSHADHCIDIIRQHIQCTADTGVFGQRWVNKINAAFVDFNTPHKCKNFDALRSWVSAHAVPRDEKIHVSLRDGEEALENVP